MEQEEIRFQQLSDQVQGNKEQILLMTTMLKQQGTKIDKIYESLIGNGSPDSIVARLLIAEKCQQDASAERHEMTEKIDKLDVCVTKLDKRSTNDYRTIQELKEGQEQFSEDLTKNTGTIEAWRNRAVGIGVGAGLFAGLGTSIIIYLLQKLIESSAVP